MGKKYDNARPLPQYSFLYLRYFTYLIKEFKDSALTISLVIDGSILNHANAEEIN